ncbi:hypothetical protein RHSIM_Rhsim06G0236700 [Rhododendron simsii]|uniref:Uncharacterized protein n=1 Tax=Rhododendron simsii TaxID=118357 RepID=A0A834GXZ7_RHOSS|nr:hypothetical protein RHSIM_Rhsim06G0236700 [Rhododendron simsii]
MHQYSFLTSSYCLRTDFPRILPFFRTPYLDFSHILRCLVDKQEVQIYCCSGVLQRRRPITYCFNSALLGLQARNSVLCSDLRPEGKMASNIKMLKDMVTGDSNWTAEVIVIEKGFPRHTEKNRLYQKLVFIDFEVMAAMSKWWHKGYLRKKYNKTYEGSSSEEDNDEEEVNDDELSQEEGDNCPPRPKKKKTSKGESKKKKKVPAPYPIETHREFLTTMGFVGQHAVEGAIFVSGNAWFLYIGKRQ